MVLVAATVLPHVPKARKGTASGAIFLGLGLGIAGSGTIIPLLLNFGLRETWIGLAVVSRIADRRQLVRLAFIQIEPGCSGGT